jgi:membrane fusion protein (multidrug efflux system)
MTLIDSCRASLPYFLIVLTLVVFTSCGDADREARDPGIPLPVFTVKKDSTVTTFEYLGVIEGKVNVEIRPQVEGLLDSIYVDEGQFVKANQPLFKINAQPYLEQLKNTKAAVEVARAKLKNARTNFETMKLLYENEVISDVQLQLAESNLEVAQASLDQALALQGTAQINVDFTLIRAPVNGYIGRIPKRIGNLVAKNDSEPVTVLSDIHEVYVYFAMSESNYLFYKKMSGDSTVRRLSPYVKLVLADGKLYDHIGIIDADAGQINRSTGAITLRAKFPNPDNLLRSGNTGKIILEQIHPDVILVPQQATSVIQDKTFVFVMRPDSVVERREVRIEGKSGKNYIVDESGHTTVTRTSAKPELILRDGIARGK